MKTERDKKYIDSAGQTMYGPYHCACCGGTFTLTADQMATKLRLDAEYDQLMLELDFIQRQPDSPEARADLKKWNTRYQRHMKLGCKFADTITMHHG
jgi:hypothetical protein